MIDSPELEKTEEVTKLRNDLLTRYGHLNEILDEEINKVVKNTQHWLKDFPASLSLHTTMKSLNRDIQLIAKIFMARSVGVQGNRV